MLGVCIRDICRGLSRGAVREKAVCVKGGRRGLFRWPAPKSGVKGVRGVLGADMYRPLHFGQRIGLADDGVEAGCTPFGLPALRGWYRYPGYCR
jgi:hypothetical protein